LGNTGTGMTFDDAVLESPKMLDAVPPLSLCGTWIYGMCSKMCACPIPVVIIAEAGLFFFLLREGSWIFIRFTTDRIQLS
jgi:hypothetical protein